jgi:hypothetical protein
MLDLERKATWMTNLAPAVWAFDGEEKTEEGERRATTTNL